MTDPLTNLRAEVEALLADADSEYGRWVNSDHPLSAEHATRTQGAGMAFATVLDLIDKHTRMTLDDIPPGV